MYDISVRLADFNILIHARYKYTANLCADYPAPEPLTEETADLTVAASEEEMASERQSGSCRVPEGYLESICIYREICRRLPPLGGMLLHSAVISDGKHGYAFTADSGVGKTTHVKLWRQAFGDEISIVNGDKPILRKRDGRWYAYGTPWCGKEGWNENTSVPLAGICFLRRGEVNSIAPYNSADAVTAIMPQLILPDDPLCLMATLDLLDGLLTEIPLFELYCTISEEAARIARAAMAPAEE